MRLISGCLPEPTFPTHRRTLSSSCALDDRCAPYRVLLTGKDSKDNNYKNRWINTKPPVPFFSRLILVVAVENERPGRFDERRDGIDRPTSMGRTTHKTLCQCC